MPSATEKSVPFCDREERAPLLRRTWQLDGLKPWRMAMSKRQFGEMESGLDTARVLMLLSQQRRRRQQQHGEVGVGGVARHDQRGRVFECRTCGRRFPTFQALGGHRASHKRPRHATRAPSAGDDHDDVGAVLRLASAPLQPVSSTEAGGRRAHAHGCPVCGLEFAVGQALGGHMRRHRAVAVDVARDVARVKADDDVVGDECAGGVCLDLNLMPSENCAKCRDAALGVAGNNSVQTTILLDCPL